MEGPPVRLKLFNGSVQSDDIKILAGGYDKEAGRIVYIIQTTDGRAGTLALDISEAKAIAAGAETAPTVSKVAPEAREAAP